MTGDLQRLIDHHEIRAIIAKAALALDTRQFNLWLDLCTPDFLLVVPLDPANPIVCEGKEAALKQFAQLHHYEATTHFTGDSLTEIEGNTARAETYCLAHHLESRGDQRTNLRMAVRYKDEFARVDGTWRMTKRTLVINWSERVEAPRV